MSMIAPRLSIVIASRNDDYVSDMAERQQNALVSVIQQLEKFKLASEIIIVDWNPPADKPELARLLVWPSELRWVNVRSVVVPNEIHATYAYSDKSDMHTAAAWNVGLRRAKGQFLLPKSADTFFSDALVKYLAQEALSEDCVYRCDRVDMLTEAVYRWRKDQRLNVDDLMIKRFSRPPQPIARVPALHTNACGDFLLMSRQSWFKIHGFIETDGVFSLDVDGLALHAAVKAGAKEVELPTDCFVAKPSHGGGAEWRVRREMRPGWMLRHLLLVLGRASAAQHLAARHKYDYPKRRLRNRKGVVLPSYARNYLSRIHDWHVQGADIRINDEHWGCGGLDLPEFAISAPRAFVSEAKPKNHDGALKDKR